MENSLVQKYLSMDHEASIQKAVSVLEPILNKTNLIRSNFFSNEHGCNVYLKPENFQKTGSFKIRGAYNKISQLTEQEKSKGIIAASAGNHAQGVAFSARQMKIPSIVVMPNVTPLLKIEATKKLGSEVLLKGDVYDEAYRHACNLAEEKGYNLIHPFDDYDVICGQGTIGFEIIEELTEVDEIIVPIGGGGLISGIALAAKIMKPSVKIIGVVPKGAMSMKVSIEEGQVTRLASVKTVAEGVAVKQPGDLTFSIAKEYVDEIVSVSEKDIMESVLLLIEKHKMVSETAGAVSLAALKKRAEKDKNIVCLISGGNIDLVTISSIINQGMISRGRIMCFSVELPDKPGQLLKVAKLLADAGANVIELEHNQFKALDRYSDKVLLEVTIETNGIEHINEVISIMEDNGFTITRVY